MTERTAQNVNIVQINVGKLVTMKYSNLEHTSSRTSEIYSI